MSTLTPSAGTTDGIDHTYQHIDMTATIRTMASQPATNPADKPRPRPCRAPFRLSSICSTFQ